jgi:hypothetical protein
MAFLTQIKAKLGKILIITLVFKKTAIFLPKNWQKSKKIAIITSAPGPNRYLKNLYRRSNFLSRTGFF